MPFKNMFDAIMEEGYQQRFADERMRQQLAQQLLLHNTMTPYQQRELDLSKRRVEDEAEYRQQMLAEQQKQHGNAFAQWILQNANEIQEVQPQTQAPSRMSAGMTGGGQQGPLQTQAPALPPGAIQMEGRYFQRRPQRMINPPQELQDILGKEPIPFDKLSGGLLDGFIAARERNQAKLGQAEEMKAQQSFLQSYVDNFIKEPEQKILFQGMINGAKDGGVLNQVSNHIRDYVTKESPDAQRRAMQNRIREATTITGINYDTQKAKERAEILERAPWDIKWSLASGQSPVDFMRSMKSDARELTVQYWMKKHEEDPKKWPMPVWVNATGQKALTEIANTQQLTKEVISYLETTPDPSDPTGKRMLKDNNTPFKSLPGYVQYRIGKAGPLTSMISKMLILGIQGAGRIGKATGNSTQNITYDLKKHTPDPSHDSLQMMYEKSKNMHHYVQSQKEATIKNNNRWGMLAQGANLEDILKEDADTEAGTDINNKVDELLKSFGKSK
jgi:hypothetical protein